MCHSFAVCQRKLARSRSLRLQPLHVFLPLISEWPQAIERQLVHGRERLVLSLNLLGSEMQVALRHHERLMPQDQLQRPQVAPIGQEFHREGMPKEMGMEPGDPAGNPQAADHGLQ